MTFTKGELDSRRAQRQISDVFKNGLECGKNIAIHPLVEMTWLFRFYIPRSKCRLKISLNMKADCVLYFATFEVVFEQN